MKFVKRYDPHKYNLFSEKNQHIYTIKVNIFNKLYKMPESSVNENSGIFADKITLYTSIIYYSKQAFVFLLCFQYRKQFLNTPIFKHTRRCLHPIPAEV